MTVTTPMARYRAGVARDDEIRADDERRAACWTRAELEMVRDAAWALVRTHRTVDGPGRTLLSVVDGAAYWRLMGALDRIAPRYLDREG